MSARFDATIVRQQILALLETLAEYEASGEASPRAPSPARATQAAPEAFAAAVDSASAGGLALTDAQRRICIRVINVFETGTVGGDYGAISIFNDGPNDIRQVTYGRAQTTEYGNLRELISDYVAANGRFSAALARYVGTIGTQVGNPRHSPLVDDQTFLTLLRNAGGDPVMRQTQDAFFDRVYFQPALNWAAGNGFVKALSALVIYDSFNHSGGILSSIRAAFPEQTPAEGGDEKTWISQYVAARQNWLATNPKVALHSTVYRTKDLTREIDRNNWDLSIAPIFANGVPVDGAPDGASPAARTLAVFAAPSVDDDPAAPAPAEVSDTAGFEWGRVLANLGVPGESDPSLPATAPQAAATGVSFDLARVQAFLQACETSIPRVSYGLGKKVPRRDAVPGRDFTQVDCSGFVREAIRLATAPTLAFPDGSVVQHDWVSGHGFERSTVADGKNDDGVVRIAFLRPQDSPQGIGHVLLVSGGMTLESHSGIGPDSRKWDGSSWQAKTSVYVFARVDQVALPVPAASFAAAAPSFTVLHGHRYGATVVLGGLEQFASNDQVADRFKQLGFIDVVVTGNGSARHGEATWNGADTTAPLDSHLRDVVEVPAVSAAATQPAPAPEAASAIAPVASPAVIISRRSANVFSAAGLPAYHDGLLAVRVHPQAAAEAPLAPGIEGGPPAAAALLAFQPETVGLSALSYLERAGRVKRVVPLRESGGAAEPAAAPMPAAAALMVAARQETVPDASGGVSFIELNHNDDADQLHKELAKDPTVASVSKVAARYLEARRATRAGTLEAAAAPPQQALLWNLSKIFWREAHALTGFKDADAIKVAVLDTGVDTSHPSLKIRNDDYHWRNPDITAPISAPDFVGHGTHVSGLIAALTRADTSVKGICQCRLIVHKIFDDGTTFALNLNVFSYFVNPILYRRALAACVDNPVDVINLSIGGPAYPDAVELSLFNQLSAGTTICAAMGNERELGSPISYPAAIPGVIAVGATALDDRVAEFSNRGGHIAVSAPGKAIWSTLPQYPGQTGFDVDFAPDGTRRPGRPISRATDFDAWDGTSMAAPHVSGSVALLIAKSSAAGNKLAPEQIKEALMKSADQVPAMGGTPFSDDFGAGRINLLKLLQ
jgi:subtilisin family serine protease